MNGRGWIPSGLRVRLQNQLEALLEQAHLKLSSLVSDLLGVSARRMLQVLADGEIDPNRLAALAHCRLHATPEQLSDALGAATELSAVYRRLLQMLLDELKLQERHMEQLDHEFSVLLTAHTQPYNGWQKCPVWEWIRHSRSWPK